jgi:hypothetical protein
VTDSAGNLPLTGRRILQGDDSTSRPLRPTESCALITRYNPLISKNLVMRSPTKGMRS